MSAIKFIRMVVILCLIFLPHIGYSQTLEPVVPDSLRGRVDAERSGTHDANRIRTVFYNYGMVGDYPPDPLKVDLSVFHSVEVPKGSGENYSDGTTPFVLANVYQNTGLPTHIMETGYRERQGNSPYFNRVMRFEPRPGYFQPDPTINQGRSVAISNDSRTWPNDWVDKLTDPDDPGWSGYWNGYFGKAPGADQESFVVYDDNFYDAWNFFPDTRDLTRRGLALRVEQRGFQWANPQAGNVIFFHYDITNEGTTDYDDNIIFGLYMDSGVGGSAIGRDGIAESDDDNAYFDREAGLNLVYTWDKNGFGVQGPTGYLGYSYMETPGNGTDGIDNDLNGIRDELRDGGRGELIVGQEAILAYVQTHYDYAQFVAFYGPLEKRPAYMAGIWWTGDEDLDWVAEFDDTGADGVFASEELPQDTGERDNMPTAGEPNFDKTDLDESDQIGLTGFKMNRIRAGAGSPSTEVDNIVFFDDGKEWPKRLYEQFTSNESFDQPLVLNYNIGFLFASGPFKLKAGKRERFSLALGYGSDLRELRTTTKVVQQIYKANYQFAVPPPMPTLNAFAGDGFVTLSWDDKAERTFDPVTNINDFEGYRIYRSTDPAFLDPQVVTTATGTGPIGIGRPIAQFDLINEIYGFSKTTVEGVSYFLGEDIGIQHTFTDTTVTNGQLYYYGITSYDSGSDSLEIYPSENALTVSKTLRGGTILPKNVVEVRPNAAVLGFEAATASEVDHSTGEGIGNVSVVVKNSSLVPDDHIFDITFSSPADCVRATSYSLIDVDDRDTLFTTGTDFEGLGRGPVGSGLLPIIWTQKKVTVDSVLSGFSAQSKTNAKFVVRYSEALPNNLRRNGYPDDLEIIFDDEPLDTSIAAIGMPSKPINFKVIAKSKDGDQKLKVRFRDTDGSGTMNSKNDYIEVVTYMAEQPAQPRATWRVDLDLTGMSENDLIPMGPGDIYQLKLNLPLSVADKFSFVSRGQRINAEQLSTTEIKPYVVPNPYINAASFEPQRFAVSGRGERRIEFRGLPSECTIRIYTIMGELVQTLEHNGTMTDGYIAWDLRSKDNLEVAPGLYIYHVESDDREAYIGKFAIIK